MATATPLDQTSFGGCPHDCPDTCSMLYKVKDGRLVEVRGNPDHPFTHGSLCVKLKDYHDHHYNSERVLYPLKRNGPKGSRQYVRVTWDEALTTIKRRWTEIIDQHGAQAILPYNYLGNEGLLQGLTVGDAFFNKLGATVCEKTFCASGSSTAWLLTVGPTGGVDPESFTESKYIVLWACNSISTNIHHWRIIREAHKRGAKVVVIDTFRSRTAKEADWHLAPRPGTDGALAMAFINVLIEEDLLDHDYIEKYTVGFAELKARARDFTPEHAEKITGVAADEIRTLAREFHHAKVSVIRLGVALERSAGGGQTIRAVCCIPALTGAWKHVGGGLLQMPIWEFPAHWDRVCRPEWIRPGTRVVNTLQLGTALTGELPLAPPIKSLMIYNANPMSQAPETDKIAQGLARQDLFTVAAEHFITDTASYADIILPATMAGEHDDMMFSWGHFYWTLNQKAIEPQGECASNTDIFRRLAAMFGFDDEQFTRSDKDMIEHYVDWSAPQMQGITMETFLKHGYAHLNNGSPDARTPHKEGNFPTPSGKCEFVASLAENGNFVAPTFRQMYEAEQGGETIDPLPGYVPPRENALNNPALAQKFPLNIVSPKSHGFLNSCYANEAKKVNGQGEQFVLINAVDATARGIENGEWVKIFNDRGGFQAQARITDDVNAGIVVATLGYWRSRNRGEGSVNCVSSNAFVNMGHAPTYNDNLVEVSRAE
ncbi:MAG: molybdopterin oxidoreductase family protein [Gammaproteobacteria bacterium]|nr:molybdopterin oxidoreductase family protein [Gammaproteobacteria bacterium]